MHSFRHFCIHLILLIRPVLVLVENMDYLPLYGSELKAGGEKRVHSTDTSALIHLRLHEHLKPCKRFLVTPILILRGGEARPTKNRNSPSNAKPKRTVRTENADQTKAKSRHKTKKTKQSDANSLDEYSGSLRVDASVLKRIHGIPTDIPEPKKSWRGRAPGDKPDTRAFKPRHADRGGPPARRAQGPPSGNGAGSGGRAEGTRAAAGGGGSRAGAGSRRRDWFHRIR